jgi:hypothetical protein
MDYSARLRSSRFPREVDPAHHFGFALYLHSDALSELALGLVQHEYEAPPR